MIWRFSDGTTVELGGNIEGPTILAQQLRNELADAVVYPWAHPCPAHAVDPNDAALLDLWLRDELRRRTRIMGLKLTLQRPEGIPPLPPPPWAGQPHDPDAIY